MAVGGEVGGMVAGVDLGFEDAEEGEVAVELAVVETIADDVGIGERTRWRCRGGARPRA